jgi:hypothetical protein
MTVDRRISLTTVQQELEACKEDAELNHWEISPIDIDNQLFTVKMKSPIDQEEYNIEIQFDNYNEIPLLIEFIEPAIEPAKGQKGTQKAYPLGKGDSFFHQTGPCICHPCSRKCYKGHAGLHKDDWGSTMTGWMSNPQVNSLTNIRSILSAIYSRVSNRDKYGGRMHA